MPSTGYTCTLSPELLEKAEKELNETSKWRDRDIQALRDMVLAHKGLKCPTDDAFLLRFLRARKFDYDRAYETIINYYTIREENRDVLQNMRPSHLKDVIDSHVFSVLPKKDKHGRRVVMFKPGNWDPTKFPIYHLMKVELMSFDLLLKIDESAQVSGIVFIGNLDGVGWVQLKNIDRAYGKLITSLLQEAEPMRVKGLNVINEPSIFGTVFALLKPFMKQKMQDRLRFHGAETKALIDAVGAECLPKELGGTEPAFEELAESWNEKLRANEAYFTEMENFRIELPKKIASGKADVVDDVQGTFKKLNID